MARHESRSGCVPPERKHIPLPRATGNPQGLASNGPSPWSQRTGRTNRSESYTRETIAPAYAQGWRHHLSILWPLHDSFPSTSRNTVLPKQCGYTHYTHYIRYTCYTPQDL